MSIKPETASKYAESLAASGITLPLAISTEDEASAIDATGRDVFTVDVNNTRPDAEACQIAAWIVLAVNTCGGFKAEIVSVQ